MNPKEPWLSAGDVQRAVYQFTRDVGRSPVLEEMAERLALHHEMPLAEAKRAIVAACAETGPSGRAISGMGWVIAQDGQELERVAIGPHLHGSTEYFLAHVDWDNVVCHVNPKDLAGLEEWYSGIVALGIGDSELAELNRERLDLRRRNERMERIIERQAARLSEWEVDEGQTGSEVDQW